MSIIVQIEVEQTSSLSAGAAKGVDCKSPPPSYEQQDIYFPTVSTVHIQRPILSPPTYTAHIQKTRAERCFAYGFLIFPIWLWGFLHYFILFSEAPCTSEVCELPCWNTSPSSHILSLAPALLDSSSSPKPALSQSIPVVTRAGSDRQQIYQKEIYEQRRDEEKRWALRCGYALAGFWFLALGIAIIVLGTNAFGWHF